MAPTRDGRTERWLRGGSIVLLVLACSSGMLFASGVSTTARVIFQVLALLSFVATIAEMALAGRWRLVRTPLWFLPLLLLALAVLQLQTLPTGLIGGLQSTWEAEGQTSSFSANRYATTQWLLWMSAASMLLFVAVEQLRTIGQLQATIGSLAVLLLASGVLSKVQSARHGPEFLSLMQTLKQTMPAVGRDLTRPDSSIGPFGYLPRAELQLPGNSADGNTWFVAGPPASAGPAVAGFWRSSQWTICVLALLPVLVGLSVAKLTHARETHGKRWPSQLEGQTGLALATLAISLGMVAGFHADPWEQGIPAVAGLMLGVLLVGQPGRRMFLVIALVTAITLGASTAMRTTRPDGAASLVAERWRQALADNDSLCRLLGDHLWFGCGMGALGDAWPRYRVVSADQTQRASSLLALLGESGIVGLLLLAGSVVYVFVRWRRIRAALSSGSRTLTASMVAGLVAVFFAGMCGPGLDAPVVWVLATLLFGGLARGLSGCEFAYQGEARQ